jgi:hypothetical protein
VEESVGCNGGRSVHMDTIVIIRTTECMIERDGGARWCTG